MRGRENSYQSLRHVRGLTLTSADAHPVPFFRRLTVSLMDGRRPPESDVKDGGIFPRALRSGKHRPNTDGREEKTVQSLRLKPNPRRLTYRGLWACSRKDTAPYPGFLSPSETGSLIKQQFLLKFRTFQEQKCKVYRFCRGQAGGWNTQIRSKNFARLLGEVQRIYDPKLRGTLFDTHLRRKEDVGLERQEEGRREEERRVPLPEWWDTEGRSEPTPSRSPTWRISECQSKTDSVCL